MVSEVAPLTLKPGAKQQRDPVGTEFHESVHDVAPAGSSTVFLLSLVKVTSSAVSCAMIRVADVAAGRRLERWR